MQPCRVLVSCGDARQPHVEDRRMAIIFFIIGLVLLLAGGDLLVRGAVGVAIRLGISPLVIGLPLVGFGTSAP